jgi:hypothetical protein
MFIADVTANQFVTLVGHVLLIERFLATVLVSRYERLTTPWFSAVCIGILVLTIFNL